MNRIYGWLSSRRFNLMALGLYIILTIVMTWPVVAQLGTHIPGRFGDAWVHVWTFHWIKEALLSGQNPFYTHLLYFPVGVTLFYHSIAWVNIAAWLPLQALIGEWPAYSLVFISIYTFNGFATYLLALEWTKTFAAAFVAGLVAGFWPYIMSRTDHPNLILVGCISMVLLYLTHMFKREKKRDIWLAAFFLALLGYAGLQLLVLGGVLIGVFVLYQLIADTSLRTLRMVKRLAAVVGLALLFMAPIITPVVYSELFGDHPEDTFVAEEVAHTDLMAYVLPTIDHPLWGERIAQQFPHIFPDEEYAPFIGYAVLLLAVIGTFTQRKQTYVWWIGAISLVVLALGVVLYVNGRSYNFPLPYRLMQDTFIAKTIRQPIRFNIILSIPMAMLAAWGIVGIYQRCPRRFWAYGIIVTACLLILFEYVRPQPMLALDIPEWYQTVVASDPDEFGILGIPMDPRQNPDKYYMFYQTEHNKPLVEGHVSRIPREARTFIEALSLSDTIGIGAQMEMLADANVRYVVLHKQLAWPADIITWKRRLVREPDYEDDEVVVYEVTRFLEVDNLIDKVVSAELGLLPQTAVPETVAIGGTLPITLRWLSRLPMNQDYEVCFDLLKADGNSAQMYCAPVADCLPTSSWASTEMIRSNYLFQVDDSVATGTYDLALSLRQINGDPLALSTALGEVTVVAKNEGIDYELETAVWGDDQIVLPSYDVVDNGDALAVSLFWKAQQPIETSYKVFLHVVDNKSNELVAQIDFIPDNWVYPTNYWQCGEIIHDQVSLPISQLPPGEYTLLLGLYEEDSGVRLPTSRVNGQSIFEEIVRIARLQR
ncbi:MAG: hypothetical protein IAF02_11125 [Anaerolineae bacterium]|nr:hypothetical protein [Anaerolineae bacterium]